MIRKVISRIKTWLDEPLNNRALFGNRIREKYQMIQMLRKNYGYIYLGNNFYIIHDCSGLDDLKCKLFNDAHNEVYEIRNDCINDYPVLVHAEENDHDIIIDVLTTTQLKDLRKL